jgi:hypothetical protein
MRQKIFLRARGTCRGSHNLTRHHIPTDNEGAGAVAKGLKLASLHFSGGQRQSWMLAREGLDPAQFIRAPGPFALFGQLSRLPIDLTDRPNGLFASRASAGGVNQERIKCGLRSPFLTREPHVVERSL